MTARQEFIFLFSVSAVLSTVLGVGILAWGWPFWLLPAVFWASVPPLALFMDLLAQRKPGSDPPARRERQSRQPAGTH